MKPIREVYPDEGQEPFYGPCNYNPLLESLGHDILVQVDDSDYQGDSRLLFRREDGKIGYLNFGWGSCSGCDSLQGCETYAQIEELRDELAAAVQWFDSAEAALDWFHSADWEGKHSWHHDEQKEFLRKAKDTLASLLRPN